jgi:DNA helicase-2/ATP-dependent DNA helicase PcrA
LEEGLLPHYLAADTPDGIEEERRLAYVGITRARKKLFLTRAESRTLFTSKQGVRPEERFRNPSPFLYELPVENLDQEGGDFAESRTYEVMMDDFDMGGYAALRSKIQMPVSRAMAGGRMSSAQQSILLNQVRPATNVLVEPMELDALIPGVEVHHEVFGLGRVENIELLTDNPADSKITVFFEKLRASKRLVYRWARLTRAH